MERLAERVEHLGPPVKGADNMLKIASDARKAALDMLVSRWEELEMTERQQPLRELVDQVRAVIEQHAAPSIGATSPPGHGRLTGARVGGETIYPELRQIPTSDRALVEPLLETAPHRIEAILMAGHHDAARIERRRGQPGRLGAIHRHRLFAQDMVAL